MASLDKYTISFNEDIKGWTSFHSWSPDWMISMNSQFYSWKNGNLYRHFDPNAPRNTFYGQQYPSYLSVMVNASPSVIKELQTVSIEGNLPWNTQITAFKTETEDITFSTITKEEYVNKEGFWYAYARRNEDSIQADSAAMYGIGRIVSIFGTTIVVNGFSHALTIGDRLYNADLSFVGTVISHTRTGDTTTITLGSVTVPVGTYILGSKNARIEGGNLRGYTIRFDLEIFTTFRAELFALNVDVIKSFP